jgi:hypothetical protein
MAKRNFLRVTTLCKLELDLRPVAMQVMPSSKSQYWCAFVDWRRDGFGYQLNPADVQRIADFMTEKGTECLTDGARCYTIQGHSLTPCNPKAVEALL